MVRQRMKGRTGNIDMDWNLSVTAIISTAQNILGIQNKRKPKR
jgi:hypothetical protein